MASESEFSRQDFIPDEVLNAPLILSKNMETLLATMDKVREKSKEFASTSAGAKDTTTAAGGAAGLTAEQKELIKVQQQIAKLVAKDTEEYRKQEVELKKLRQAIKDKTALGGKEAEQADKLNSSITQLGAALAKNRREYSALTTEAERQTEAGKKLLETIQKQDEEYKELRESMGVFVDSVGAYTNSIIKADSEITRLKSENERLLAVQSKLDKETKEGKKAYDNLNVAIQNNITQINIYQKEVGQTADATKKMSVQTLLASKEMDALDNVTGGTIGRLKMLGKEFAALAASPFFLTMLAIVAAIYAANSALKAFFSTTDEGEDILEVQTAVWQSFFDAVKMGWGEVGKAIFGAYDAIGGAKTVITSLLAAIAANFPILIPMLRKINQQFLDTADNAAAIQKAFQKVNDEMLVDTITAAQKELNANKLLEASKNKLMYTDEQRLKLLQSAVALQESISKEEIKNETNLLDLERQKLANKYKGAEVLKTEFDLSEKNLAANKDYLEVLGAQIVKSGIVGEEQQQIVGHIEKIVKLQAQYYQQQKRNTSQVSALTLEIEKSRRDAAQRLVDSQVMYSKIAFEAIEKSNLLILKDEKQTAQNRINSLVEVQSARLTLIEIAQAEELEALKRASEERIRAEGITSQKEIDERLLRDKAYLTQKNVIDQKAFSSASETVRNIGNELADLTESMEKERLSVLEQSYLDGNKTLTQYQRERKRITKEANEDLFKDEVFFYSLAIEKLKEKNADVSALEKQLQDIRTEHTRQGAAERQAIEEKERAMRIQLFNSITDATIQIEANLTAKKEMQLDRRLEDLKKNYDLQMKLAGDDVKLKEKLAVDFAKREKELNDEKRALQRKQAIFEKTLAISQATVNTYLAATAQLEIPFLFAATLALGLAQIAVIASTPIPEAEFGIKNHKGGPLRVSEAGEELIVYPGGKVDLTPKHESVINAPAGTEVIPHSKTTRMLALAALAVPDSVTVDYGLHQEVRRLGTQLTVLADSIYHNNNSTRFFHQGVTAYRVSKARDGHETIMIEYITGSNK